jgi:hypothetical protein
VWRSDRDPEDVWMVSRERYCAAYPDEAQRYGAAGRAWCVHDNLHLLGWAFGAVNGDVRFEAKALWLARVLSSRDYPLDRLAHDLRMLAEVVLDERVAQATAVAAILRAGAIAVERHASQSAPD